VVVAEGAQPKEGSLTLADAEVDAFGHVRLGGIANVLATEIEARTGYETRVTILGHVQRGGTPTAYDRVLATRFGIAAIDAVHDGAFGEMVALRADSIVRVPLAEAVGELKLIDPQLYHGVADVFFG
jgi:6-phosphofructokinase 1